MDAVQRAASRNCDDTHHTKQGRFQAGNLLNNKSFVVLQRVFAHDARTVKKLPVRWY
jgi:hypothetical protein